MKGPLLAMVGGLGLAALLPRAGYLAEKPRVLAELKRACDLGFARGCASYEQERGRR